MLERFRRTCHICPNLVLLTRSARRFIPFLEWPLDSFARLLGFLFLYNSGIDELSSGYKTSDTKAEKVKSLLVTYLITSMVQLVHVFLLDVRHYLGGLSNFLLPVMLLVTPNGKGRTVAEIICDTLFSQMSTVLQSIIPEKLQASPEIIYLVYR